MIYPYVNYCNSSEQLGMNNQCHFLFLLGSGPGDLTRNFSQSATVVYFRYSLQSVLLIDWYTKGIAASTVFNALSTGVGFILLKLLFFETSEKNVF